MTRYLLDTNVIGDAVKPAPPPKLLAWMSARRDEDLCISSVAIAEIWRGILEKPAGRKRRELESWFAGPEGPPALFAGRILPFDDRAGLIWARLMAQGTAASRPRNAIDMIVAAIAEANGCIVATGNERDFAGLATFNPARD